jgi:antitoxin component YwqK of YwqJK toxin-antitoxin module
LNPNVNVQKFYNNKLPITFNPLEFGVLIDQDENRFTVKMSDKAFVIIKQVEDSNGKINQVKYFKDNVLMYEWKDYYISDTSFRREIGKSIYTYANGELLLLTVLRPGKFIAKTKKAKESFLFKTTL